MRTVSELARALVALLYARLPVGDEPEKVLSRVDRAVRDLEKADRDYQKTIERTLPRTQAREMLATMEKFRRDVVAIRNQARNSAPYGDFDPLDTFVPSFGGSHAEATRAANVGDRARQMVDDARAHVNSHVVEKIGPSELQRLLDAKRKRGVDFERIIAKAVPRDVGEPMIAQLAQVADGWF
ncbi:MAG TPA: hypothetical protein VGG22_04655 [Candidatus Baltobacteraceae bacterium]|jgi:hypothetical protein